MLSFCCLWPRQYVDPLEIKKKIQYHFLCRFSDLAVLFPSFCLPISLAKYPFLEEVQFICGQGMSQGTEEAVIVGCVVDHEQDSGQKLIGHQQMMHVCPLVVPTAVASAPLHQGPEVILVPD